MIVCCAATGAVASGTARLGHLFGLHCSRFLSLLTHRSYLRTLPVAILVFIMDYRTQLAHGLFVSMSKSVARVMDYYYHGRVE